MKLICYEIILNPKGVYQVSKKNINSIYIYIYIYEIVMCKRSTEELILNQSMCVSHRPLFCVASSVFTCPYIKIQMPSFVMPAQTVVNTGVIKKFSSVTSERHVVMLILLLDVGTMWKCPVFPLSSSGS